MLNILEKTMKCEKAQFGDLESNFLVSNFRRDLGFYSRFGQPTIKINCCQIVAAANQKRSPTWCPKMALKKNPIN